MALLHMHIEGNRLVETCPATEGFCFGREEEICSQCDLGTTAPGAFPDAEFMFKVGFNISWAGTGTGIFAGSGRQNTYTPLVDFGLGFGTLPPALKYLRPFAITAEFSTTSPGQDWTAGVPNVTTFSWGFTLQYSLPYFPSRRC
jgi:hypothetical protein